VVEVGWAVGVTADLALDTSPSQPWRSWASLGLDAARVSLRLRCPVTPCRARGRKPPPPLSRTFAA